MYRNFIAAFTLSIIFIIAIFFYFRGEVKEQKLNHILDQITSELNIQLKTNQMNALQTAIVLSQNSGLVNALENDDEDLGYIILSKITENIKKNTDRFVRTQVITSDYHIFARSWDNVYAGMPLGDYRTDLNYFKTHKSPRTSIEVGRRLGIKATVPIYKENTLLGFIEVIDFFEPLTELFRAQGIDLYVLLNDKYFNTAIFMQENMMVNKYIIANTNYNSNHIDVLKSIDFKQLKANRILSTRNRHLFYESMHNGDGQSIGAFVFILPDKYLEYFRDPEDDISFLINITRSSLYNIEKNQNFSTMYDAYTPQELTYIKEIVSYEDEAAFSQSAYKKLDKYSKDELIQLILQRKIIKKIDGKIK
ncbi:hypothetical protein KKA17_04265 [bacterium]|nr:hypothetical protein [bacterium]MBU1884966.1 hypothetical protein [bacterium]